MHLGCRSLAVAPRGLCAAHRLGMGLSAQPPDSTPAAAIGLHMVWHHLTDVQDGRLCAAPARLLSEASLVRSSSWRLGL